MTFKVYIHKKMTFNKAEDICLNSKMTLYEKNHQKWSDKGSQSWAELTWIIVPVSTRNTYNILIVFMLALGFKQAWS